MLAPWKQSYDKHRQHIKKERRNFADKGSNGQSYGFSSSHVWMWELDHKEAWAPKNWCFWTVVLERLMRVPWTARRSNQSILKEISPEYSLKGLMLKLKLQYSGHLMWRTDSLGRNLMLSKSEGRRRRGWQRGWDSRMASLTQWWSWDFKVGWREKLLVLPPSGTFCSDGWWTSLPVLGRNKD